MRGSTCCVCVNKRRCFFFGCLQDTEQMLMTLHPKLEHLSVTDCNAEQELQVSSRVFLPGPMFTSPDAGNNKLQLRSAP